jgi:asparagine synthase (glutamine-hydrolysing)
MGSVVALLPRSGAADPRVAGRMLAAAPHRGARAETVTIGGSVLGISRSEREDTSLHRTDGVAVALAGKLDNHEELARELRRAGRNAGDGSPAALVAEAYAAFGAEMPVRLRGIFAGVIADGSRLLCFRDHLGFGTLYYRHDSSGAYAGTEAKQVVAGAPIAPEPDLDVVEQIFFRSYGDQTSCALKGVQRLPKASMLVLDGDTRRINRFWDPETLIETGPALRHDEMQERFDELMTQALRRSLTGEDSVSLSGGIDSPAVAAYAAPRHLEMTGRPLRAASIVYPEFPSVDERAYVELVAAELGLELHTFEQRTAPLDELLDWVGITDGPVPTVALPQYAEHYRHVRSIGCTNVLTGELAEFVCDMASFLLQHLLTHRRFSALAHQIRVRRAKGNSVPSLARQLAVSFVPAPLARARWRLDRRDIPNWLDPRRVNEPIVRSIVPASRRWRKLQLTAFASPGISIEADDIVQELCGVRTRRPWADVDLWEFFLGLPAEVKFPDAQSKGLVRRLLRGRVPDAILDRRDKTVFDESIVARIDYATLRRWLVEPGHRLNGVRYELLRERLEKENLSVGEFIWAKDLAAVHAFLSRW